MLILQSATPRVAARPQRTYDPGNSASHDKAAYDHLLARLKGPLRSPP